MDEIFHASGQGCNYGIDCSQNVRQFTYKKSSFDVRNTLVRLSIVE